MTEKPLFAIDYRREDLELVRQTCLYVATKLGDLLDDLVVVGGLVPSLIIPDESLLTGEDVHIGTTDLDLGLSLAILDTNRYEDLLIRLNRAGFNPDENEEGNPTLQRWKITPSADLKVTLDFLISPSLATDKGGDLRHIQKDLAAVITPGLRLAFKDKQKVSLRGLTLLGEKANRDVWVCGPGAFVVLKALAFDRRGENKDAYDLYFVIRNYGSGIDDIYGCLRPLLKEEETKKALEILNRDFMESNTAVPVISKVGKVDLRYALYQAAKVATSLTSEFKAYFKRLIEGREREKGILTKMRVKVASKLLVIAWTLMKTKKPYKAGLLVTDEPVHQRGR